MEIVTVAKDGSGRKSLVQDLLDKGVLSFKSPGLQIRPEISIHSNKLRI